MSVTCDVTPNTSSEQVIRRLYQITNAHNQGFEAQLLELLKMGLERFNLDIGILSRIQGNEYVVKHCVTPEGVELHAGDSFTLDTTYCGITCEASAPVALEYIGENDIYASHPAYKAFGLESYIGMPIRLNGKLYGTLNFSSPHPYPRHFQEIDIDALQLMASWIEVELIRRQQEQQLNRLNEKLKHLANYDSLTDIPNRRGMYRKLKKSINQLIRTQGHGTLAIVDIDHFKKLNDTYGHQLGDKALVETANKISASIRDYDFVARLGGEEFLIWLPNSNQQGCAAVFSRVMKAIGSISLTAEPITVSIGAYHLAFNDVQLPDDFEMLADRMIALADEALYQAKETGRNKVISRTGLIEELHR
ncbi:sensor domain-containing diguanylate cyclase [Agarivorans sp. MS3-6]